MLKNGKNNLGPCKIKYSFDVDANYYEALEFSDKKGGVQLEISPKFYKSQNDDTITFNNVQVKSIGVNVKFVSENVSEDFTTLLMPYLEETESGSHLYRLVAKGTNLSSKMVKLFIRPKDNTDDSQDIIIYNAINISVKKFDWLVDGNEVNEYNFMAVTTSDGLTIDFNFAEGDIPTPTEIAWILSDSSDYTFDSDIEFASAKLVQDSGLKYVYIPRLYLDTTDKITIERYNQVDNIIETLTPTNNNIGFHNAITDIKLIGNYLYITFHNNRTLLIYDITNNDIITFDLDTVYTTISAETNSRGIYIAYTSNDNEIFVVEFEDDSAASGNDGFNIVKVINTNGAITTSNFRFISDSWKGSVDFCGLIQSKSDIGKAYIISDGNYAANEYIDFYNGGIVVDNAISNTDYYLKNYYNSNNILSTGESDSYIDNLTPFFSKNNWIKTNFGKNGFYFSTNSNITITFNDINNTLYIYNDSDFSSNKTLTLINSFSTFEVANKLINFFINNNDEIVCIMSNKIIIILPNSGAYDIKTDYNFNSIIGEYSLQTYYYNRAAGLINFRNTTVDFSGQVKSFDFDDTIPSLTDAYKDTTPTIKPKIAITLDDGVSNLKELVVGGDNVDLDLLKFRITNDDGVTWYYYNSGWIESTDKTMVNTITEINTNISSFDISTNKVINWQGVLYTNIAKDETPDFSVVTFELNR